MKYLLIAWVIWYESYIIWWIIKSRIWIFRNNNEYSANKHEFLRIFGSKLDFYSVTHLVWFIHQNSYNHRTNSKTWKYSWIFNSRRGFSLSQRIESIQFQNTFMAPDESLVLRYNQTLKQACFVDFRHFSYRIQIVWRLQ